MIKQRAKLMGRVPMPEQPPQLRVGNFDEVPLGYDTSQAQAEAARCLQCKNPRCREGCPVGVDIPGFVSLIAEGQHLQAAARIKETNCLPAVCGRVCPQESQCEAQCVLGRRGDAVAIGRLERFAADFEYKSGQLQIPAMRPSTGKRVAVIGAGPAGLTVAGDLVREGHAVTIFEAFHKAGGVLVYGIPEFRLPKRIVEQEVDYLRHLGVRIQLNHVVGQSVTVRDLLDEEGFDAVFLAVGAGLPVVMRIPGENLVGVYLANEYLTRVNLMQAYAFPAVDTPVVRGARVCVVGGGNVAMDAARTARRMDGEQVTVLYRRTLEELPARAEEVHHAQAEGIEFRTLCAPVEYLGDAQGVLRQVRCQTMELGEPDESGRRRPVPKHGEQFLLDADLVIVAIGSGANPLLTRQTPEVALDRRGHITTNSRGLTSCPGVWAGGDIVTGSATVILAMGAGRLAAQDIHRYLSRTPVPGPVESVIDAACLLVTDSQALSPA